MKQKNFVRADNKLSNFFANFDKMITIIFNSLWVGYNNLAFNIMVSSARIEQDDHYLGGKVLKRQKACKELFVDGKQESLFNLKACCANMCSKLQTMYVNTKQSILHKSIEQLLTSLHGSNAQSWLTTEIQNKPYYLHSMFCQLQQYVTAITTCLCKNKDILCRLQQGEVIYSPSCTASTTCAGNNFVNNIMIELEQPAAGH